MVRIVIFPNFEAFEQGQEVLLAAEEGFEVLQPPDFCHGLVAPAVLLAGGATNPLEKLRSLQVSVSGVLSSRLSGREVPDAPPPNDAWKTILGDLTIHRVGPSLSDPLKSRVEIVPGRPLTPLIPIMARLIRGGAFNPDGPVLAFEEEHRLLSVSSDGIVICRADDLLDICVLLRCMVDLVVDAWNRRLDLKPETQPRHGIGPIEIFKRLPGTNCRQCLYPNCMEFSMDLFRGKSTIEHCKPCSEEAYSRNAESLRWLARIIGLRLAH